MRATIAALLVGCACTATPYSVEPRCTTDLECPAQQLCFAEGCGDPGTDIVVEVSGAGLTNQFARDFPIADGTITATLDFNLGPPLSVNGEFQRERGGGPDPTNRSAYSDPVRLIATGASDLIPGLPRSFDQRVEAPLRGTYQLFIGAGTYQILALPADPSVPPVTTAAISVNGSTSPVVDFVFPSVDGAVTLSGRLLKTIDTSVVPTRETALTQAGSAIDVQAFDPLTRTPLSQRFPVSSGQVGANGNFTITLNPNVKELAAVLLVATPRNGASATPAKEFRIPVPLPPVVTLEMGAFGDAVTVTGVAKSLRGFPIANAQVVLEGTVVGDGTFRSQVVTTSSTGEYALTTLPSKGTMTLTISPPPESSSAVTSSPVRVPATGGALQGVPPCDDRVVLTGKVLLPSGASAPNVLVRAVERASAIERPLLLDPVETVTGPDGVFVIRLDVSTWRLDVTAPDLPLASRLVTIETVVNSSGTTILSRSLPTPIQLASGRTISGTVLGQLAKVDSPLAFANLRFFRVRPVSGEASAILLGTALADERGHYSVTLPSTR